MIGFLSQYVYGLGHSNRTKLIAEEVAKHKKSHTARFLKKELNS